MVFERFAPHTPDYPMPGTKDSIGSEINNTTLDTTANFAKAALAAAEIEIKNSGAKPGETIVVPIPEYDINNIPSATDLRTETALFENAAFAIPTGVYTKHNEDGLEVAVTFQLTDRISDLRNTPGNGE